MFNSRFSVPHKMSKFYAVVVGKEPGIYTSWAECSAQVTGHKGAVYKSFPTHAQAAAFLTPETVPTTTKGRTLYCDGGHNAQTGKDAWASVVNDKGKDMIGKYDYLFTDEKMKEVVLPVGLRKIIVVNYSDVTAQQNNGAELIGMWASLLICLHNKKYRTICSDSQLIIDYWSKKLNPAKQMCPRKKAVVLEVIKLRKEFEAKGGVVVKIPGAENPADLGYHK